MLVIDDESSVAITIRRALASDHDVDASLTDPNEALAPDRGGERFDVILCDLMMPQSPAWTLHAAAPAGARPTRPTRIVFITGGAFTVHRPATFLDEVANARLEKPFDLTNLRALVNDRVGSS